MNNILDKVKNLCLKHNITVADLARDLDIVPSTISKWSKFTPSIDKLSLIADYFNVSIDYLIGRTSIPTQIDQSFSDPDIATIQRLRANLSPRDRQKMMNVMRAQFSDDFPKDEENDHA